MKIYSPQTCWFLAHFVIINLQCEMSVHRHPSQVTVILVFRWRVEGQNLLTNHDTNFNQLEHL